MRLLSASLAVLVTLASSNGALSSEVFLPQISSHLPANPQAMLASANALFTEVSAEEASAKQTLTSSLTLLPNLQGMNLPTSSTGGANLSEVIQSGKNNNATVMQFGGGNISLVMQQGQNNTAVVLQSTRAH